MKLAVIVTEFPKTTETFILRDMMVWHEAGVDLRLYHLGAWNHAEILHDFAAPLAKVARHVPLARAVTLAGAVRHLPVVAARGGTILRHQSREPALAGKSLALLPAGIGMGRDLADWGADHIHAEFAGHPATAAWIAHRVTGIPYSISCRAHDIFRSQRLLEQKFREAAAIRTVSDFARDFLRRTVPGAAHRPIEVIHSSVDVAAIPAPPYTRNPDQFRILYTGSLTAKKGVPVLLDALAGFDRPGWQLDLAGDGPDRATLEQQVARLGLKDRVRFLGQQQFDALTSLYARADVCVAPSIIGPGGRAEGIPNVMIEALAYGRPAISTRISGIPELIRDGQTGWLVPPADATALRAALCAVHDDPDEAARRAAAGRRLVEQEFDVRKNAMRQLALFEAASGQRGVAA